MNPFIGVGLTVICTLVVLPAQAGSTRAEAPVYFQAGQIAAFAKKLEREVAARGARVFVVARRGRPLEELPKGVRYTHVGFGLYTTITTADGRELPGYAMYNLYQDPERPNRSDLVQDFPVDFFAGAQVLEAAVIVPTAAMQRRLFTVINSDTYRALHQPRYSVIANPFDTGYQNCTEFVLDVINAAVYGTGDVAQLKVNARGHFRPQALHIGPFRTLFGALGRQELAFDDHDGTVMTATYTTIARYMRDNGMVQEELTVQGL